MGTSVLRPGPRLSQPQQWSRRWPAASRAGSRARAQEGSQQGWRSPADTPDPSPWSPQELWPLPWQTEPQVMQLLCHQAWGQRQELTSSCFLQDPPALSPLWLSPAAPSSARAPLQTHPGSTTLGSAPWGLQQPLCCQHCYNPQKPPRNSLRLFHSYFTESQDF